MSERPVRRYHKGVARREWVPVGSARNEPLDCRIYAMAAMEGLKATGVRLPTSDKPVRLTAEEDAGVARPKRHFFGQPIAMIRDPYL